MLSGRIYVVALLVVGGIAAPVHGQSVEPTILQSFRASFERNAGQAASDAVFVAHDAGYDLVLTRGAGVIRSAGHRDLRIVFSGGDATVLPVGGEQSSGLVHYLRGNEPARWHRNITTFQRVTYPRVYPGIDVVYHASQGQMEYDIVVAAGADPDRVRMRFEGADRVVLQHSGDLAVHLDDRIVTVKRPVLYQETGDGRRTVEGTFVRLAGGDIGFDVGAYDPQTPLIIDPVLVYSSFLPMRSDGALLSSHVPAAIAVGADGATYLFGTVATPFDGGLFVAKINPSGATLAFITYLGGTSAETAKALALGPLGEMYVAGETSSWDFPTMSAAQSVYGGGIGDAYLAKLSAAGDALEYATFAGGGLTDRAEALVVDADSSAYLVGTTGSPDFPLLASPAAYGGMDDAFIVKYDEQGNRVFSILLGGASQDQAHAATLAPDGALVVAGHTFSDSFPVTPGAHDTILSSFEGFISRLRPSDGLLLQSTFLGGTSADRVFAVDTDASGAVYVTGSTSSTNFPTTPGVVQTSGPNDGGNAFVTKLSADLGTIIYSTYLAGSSSDFGSWIAVDGLGQAIVAGATSSSNFAQFAALFSFTAPPVPPSFITKLSASGSQYVYSTFWPASLTAMTSGPTGDAYVAGTISSLLSRPYPTTPDALLAPATFDSGIRSVFARISDASSACSYHVRPSTVIVGSSSGTHSLSVVAPSGCSWSVFSSDPSWLVASTPNGTSVGTATFTVTSLISGFRSATLSIGMGSAVQVVTVYQRSCLTTSSSVPLQPAAGGAVVVSVTGSAGCPFVAATDAPWITVAPHVGVLDGAGQAQVTLTLSPSTAISQRSATVTIGDSALSGSRTVQQAGRCTASLSSSSLTAHRTGSTALVTVTVAPPDCAWTVRSDSPWLVPSVSSAVGTQTIAITASAVTTFSRTGHLSIAELPFTVSQNAPTFSNTPVVYPPVPPAGSGHAQTFTFSFLDSNGAANLSVVNVLINNFLDGGSACYLAYARSINVLYLVNDAGDALLPGMVLNGGVETLGNSQCSIDGSGSSVTVNGDVLTLTLKMAFSAPFAGNKVVYQAARNEGGFNSGWVQQGVWNVPSPTSSSPEVVSLTPSRNAVSGYPLQFRFRHADGADHLVSTSILINSYLDGFQGCYLGYHVPTNAVLLLNDAGNGYVGSVVLGTNTVIENSQCRIRALQSGVAADGTDLTLTLLMDFKAGLAGDRVFYVSAQDDVSTSGWQAVGSWTVP